MKPVPNVSPPAFGIPAQPALGPGGLVLLEQHKASASATLDFTSCISSTYDEYQIEIVGLLPATNSVALWMRMGSGGGPTYDTGANYGWAGFVQRAGGTGFAGSEGGATKIQIGFSAQISNNASWPTNASFRLYNPQSASLFKTIQGMVSQLDVGPFRILSNFIGSWESATAMTAFQFLFSSGNITSGIIRVYGIAKT